MASIEVSLAGTRRRSAGREIGRELDVLRSAITDKDTLIQRYDRFQVTIKLHSQSERVQIILITCSLKKQLSASLSAARLASTMSSPTSPRGSPREEVATTLSADDRRALEERAAAVRADLEARKTNIQELRRRLEKTHVTEYDLYYNNSEYFLNYST